MSKHDPKGGRMMMIGGGVVMLFGLMGAFCQGDPGTVFGGAMMMVLGGGMVLLGARPRSPSMANLWIKFGGDEPRFMLTLARW